jgi:hypothetical protein
VCDRGLKKIVARAEGGVVVGATHLGLVKKPSSRLASDARASDATPQAQGKGDPLEPGKDQDGDGIVGAFDVDDNGNGVVDNTDGGQVRWAGARGGAGASCRRRAHTSQASFNPSHEPSHGPPASHPPLAGIARHCPELLRFCELQGEGGVGGGARPWTAQTAGSSRPRPAPPPAAPPALAPHPTLTLPPPKTKVELGGAQNVYCPQWNETKAEATFKSTLQLAMQNKAPPGSPVTVSEARLECNGLPYCKSGGGSTGKWVKSMNTEVAFPDDPQIAYDATKGGGLMPTSANMPDFQLKPYATFSEINAGDTFIGTATISTGEKLVLPG